MNLLEHYINKVINIENVSDFDTKIDFIIVTMEVCCYGSIETIRKSYISLDEFHKDLEKGYFLD